MVKYLDSVPDGVIVPKPNQSNVSREIEDYFNGPKPILYFNSDDVERYKGSTFKRKLGSTKSSISRMIAHLVKKGFIKETPYTFGHTIEPFEVYLIKDTYLTDNIKKG